MGDDSFKELSEWRGWRRFDRMLVRYAILAIAILVLVSLTFYWIGHLNEQFRDDERVRFATQTLLALQLDEETGLRGYDATGSPEFLEPYNRARGKLDQSIDALARQLDNKNASDALADFRNRHTTWSESVAQPVLAHPGSHASSLHEMAGKSLVDEMRGDIERIDATYDDLGKAALAQANLFRFLCEALILVVILLIALVGYTNERRSASREEALLVDVIEHRDSATRLSDWRSKVIAMLAHDFRSTLGVIKAYSDILQYFPERRPDPEIYRGIETAVEELVGMSDEALLMARMTGGALNVAREQLPLSEIVGTIVNRYDDRRDIAFRPADIRVMGDRHYLLRVFDNIIGNAIKYSPAGTPINVRMAPVSDRLVEVCVSDRGKGIDARELPHIFEEYWRSPDAQHDKGSGVGLFIVKKIVEAHDGSVFATSRIGEGTTICVTFPLN